MRRRKRSADNSRRRSSRRGRETDVGEKGRSSRRPSIPSLSCLDACDQSAAAATGERGKERQGGWRGRVKQTREKKELTILLTFTHFSFFISSNSRKQLTSNDAG